MQWTISQSIDCMVKSNELLARRLQVSNLTTRQFSLMVYDHMLSAATAVSDLSHTLEEDEVVAASDLSYALPPGELATVEAELEEVVAEAGGERALLEARSELAAVLEQETQRVRDGLEELLDDDAQWEAAIQESFQHIQDPKEKEWCVDQRRLLMMPLKPPASASLLEEGRSVNLPPDYIHRLVNRSCPLAFKDEEQCDDFCNDLSQDFVYGLAKFATTLKDTNARSICGYFIITLGTAATFYSESPEKTVVDLMRMEKARVT